MSTNHVGENYILNANREKLLMRVDTGYLTRHDRQMAFLFNTYFVTIH
jgi:hypothetical protein